MHACWPVRATLRFLHRKSFTNLFQVSSLAAMAVRLILVLLAAACAVANARINVGE